MQLEPNGLEQAIAAAFCTRENGNIDFDAAIATAINAYLEAAPSPSSAPGVVEALTAAKDFIAMEYADARQEQYGEWLAPEARKVFGLICEALASLSQPAKEREGGGL